MSETQPLMEATHPALSDYPWIHAWAQWCNHPADWLEEQLAAAFASSAPRTSIFHSPGQRWCLLEDVVADEPRWFLIDWAADYALTIPDRVYKVWVSPRLTMSRPSLALSTPDVA